MFLRKITLINFQNHTYSTFDLLNGLNVFRGSSDSGKSAVIRAIKWVMTNRPLGDSLKKHGAESIKVVLEFDDCIVEREKNKKFNGYRLLLKDSGLEKVYNVIKSDVPDEISSILNIFQDSLQSQEDPYFLLQSTPGEVAAKLNEAADMDVISRISKQAVLEVRNAELEVRKAKDKIEELDYEKKKLSGIKGIKKKYDNILKSCDDLSVMETLYDSIKSIISDIEETSSIILKSDIKNKYSEADISKFQNRYLDCTRSINSDEEKINRISSLISNISNIEKKVFKPKSDSKLVVFYNKCNDLVKKLHEDDLKIAAIEKIIYEIEACSVKLDSGRVKIVEIKNLARPIFDKLELCLFCGSDIGKDKSKSLFEKWSEV